MKSSLTRTILIVAACALTAAFAFPWPARGQRAAEAGQRPDVRQQPQQEPVERLPAPAERADNPAVTPWFADSFRLRNCRVCYAVLQLRARHYGIDNFINDAVIAGLA